MKECSYCGRKNADDAESCQGCGSRDFAMPDSSCSADESKPKHIRFRLLLASAMGLTVAVLSIYVAWLDFRNAYGLRPEQYITQLRLDEISETIGVYQKQHHKPPMSMDDLFPGHDPELDLDGWKRPFVFETNGMRCLVISYGRDGKPGGEGLDCDLTTENPWHKESGLTFRQFVETKRSSGIKWSCVVCGFLMFALTFITARKPEMSNRTDVFTLVTLLVVTFIGAMVVGSIITALHVPTGH
jgi:hypothetical protein